MKEGHARADTFMLTTHNTNIRHGWSVTKQTVSQNTANKTKPSLQHYTKIQACITTLTVAVDKVSARLLPAMLGLVGQIFF